MHKKIYLLLALVILAFNGFTQGVIKFKEDKFDFGMVDEGNMATHEFEFTNTGNTPIVLSDVRASCGCTTPSWTKDPVPPGGKGTIKASYNSEGRPGTFVKTITITSNAADASKILYIKGIVDPKKEKLTYTPAQLKTSPKISVDKLNHNFGKLERGQKVSNKFTIKNSGKEPLVIKSVQSACNCITHKIDKETIPPGKSAIMEITYGPTYDGLNNDIVIITTNDLKNGRTQINLQSEVVESLTTKTPLKEEKTSVPFGK